MAWLGPPLIRLDSQRGLMSTHLSLRDFTPLLGMRIDETSFRDPCELVSQGE